MPFAVNKTPFGHTPSADDAAVMLHRVIQHLRTEHTGRPHLWASLIHSGP